MEIWNKFEIRQLDGKSINSIYGPDNLCQNYIYDWADEKGLFYNRKKDVIIDPFEEDNRIVYTVSKKFETNRLILGKLERVGFDVYAEEEASLVVTNGHLTIYFNLNKKTFTPYFTSMQAEMDNPDILHKTLESLNYTGGWEKKPTVYSNHI